MCEQKKAAESKVDRLIDELTTMNALLRDVVQRLDARNILVTVPSMGPDLAEVIAPLPREFQSGSLKVPTNVR